MSLIDNGAKRSGTIAEVFALVVPCQLYELAVILATSFYRLDTERRDEGAKVH